MPRRRLLLFSLVFGLAASAGIAYATIPDAGGVIHACYSNNAGAVRVIDATAQACKGSETALNWSQTGPQGPPGPPGPAGITTGFFRERLTGGPLLGSQDVLTLEVSARRSMLFATVQLGNENDVAARPGICDLVSPDGTARRGFVDIQPNSRAQLTLIGVGTLPGTAKITCYDPGDGSIFLDVPTTLSAVEVSALDQQPPQ